jgi:exopolyphosphatase / guanosine-5'-triphosphate,3'-diphosphate pyrophosphatase
VSDRYASIDVGTNSVLLLVAERADDGRFSPVKERAEITRLGRGVDKSGRLADEAIADTVAVITDYAKDARALGAKGIVVSATSAARDAANGRDFMNAVKQQAGVEVQIISGDEEARLSFASAWSDFGGRGPLIVLDIGGGSTEFIFGDAQGQIVFRKSFQVGSVRLTERFVHSDPIPAQELEALSEHLVKTFAELPEPPADATLVAVAGTATTVLAVARAIDPYDAVRVHGARMKSWEVHATARMLGESPLAERRKLPGLQPKRADVIVAGSLILVEAMTRLGSKDVVISDRGLRWGLLADRFGPGARA